MNRVLSYLFYGIDTLGLGFPVVALAWSLLLGQCMSLVYIPEAPYTMLALMVWVTVLLTRLFRAMEQTGLRKSSVLLLNFPGGWPVLVSVCALALGIVVWLSLYVVGLRILEFAWYPLAFLVLYSYQVISKLGSVRVPLLAFLFGGLAFAYGCALVVWYSAAIYSVYSFLVDQRTLYLGVLMMIFLLAIYLWGKEDEEKRLMESLEEDWDEEEMNARLMVWVSVPLLILGAFSLYSGYHSQEGSQWFFYSIALSALSLHVLNHLFRRFSFSNVRVLGFLCLVLPVGVFYL